MIGVEIKVRKVFPDSDKIRAYAVRVGDLSAGIVVHLRDGWVAIPSGEDPELPRAAHASLDDAISRLVVVFFEVSWKFE